MKYVNRKKNVLVCIRDDAERTISSFNSQYNLRNCWSKNCVFEWDFDELVRKHVFSQNGRSGITNSTYYSMSHDITLDMGVINSPENNFLRRERELKRHCLETQINLEEVHIRIDLSYHFHSEIEGHDEYYAFYRSSPINLKRLIETFHARLIVYPSDSVPNHLLLDDEVYIFRETHRNIVPQRPPNNHLENNDELIEDNGQIENDNPFDLQTFSTETVSTIDTHASEW